MKSLDEIIGIAKSWIGRGDNNMINEGELQNIFIPLAQVLLTIAVGVLIVATIIMGIKYMTGNAEQQAKLKQQAIGLVVSAIVVFSANVIWALVYNIMNNLI